MTSIRGNSPCRPARLTVGLFAIALAALSPSIAAAACKAWKLHEFSIKQTNGFFVWGFPRDQGGGRFEGGIRQYAGQEDEPNKPEGLTAIEGKMEGRISGDDVSFTARWNNGALGEYTGQISPTGFIDGRTVDKLNPGNTAGWSQVPWGGGKLRPAADCPNVAAPPAALSEFAAFCERYASDAVAQATKNKQMKCGLEKTNPSRWTSNREAHLTWCLSQDGAYSEPTMEGSYRVAGLRDCTDRQEAMKQKGILTPGPAIGDVLKATRPAGSKPVTVLLDVEVFDTPDDPKVKLGDLKAGTLGVLLAEPCRADHWCHLIGNVPKGNGWSWSGPSYLSLKF